MNPPDFGGGGGGMNPTELGGGPGGGGGENPVLIGGGPGGGGTYPPEDGGGPGGGGVYSLYELLLNTASGLEILSER